MTIPSADTTLNAIVTKIRRLTASANESSLKTTDIYQYVNTYYNQDFPYSVKIDQQRNVYTFFTEPNRDRYPVDVNNWQGFRAPVYFEGIQGTFYKDRQQFYNIWPRFPTKFQPISGDGMTTTFSFTIQGPFLSKEVVLGGVDINGNPISVNDDGEGNLQLQVPNPVVSVPAFPYTNPATPPTPIPGMYNRNTQNPGLNYVGTLTSPYTMGIGTVNYVTGQFNITFPVAPAAGQQMTLWVYLYQTGRPYCLLFWNNELHVRPIPKLIHKVEVECYQTPVQFMNTSDSPILNQWWQLISLGSSIKILEDRQDMEGVENLKELYNRQQDLVLERQGVEEIFEPNRNLFNSSNMNSGVGGGIGGTAGFF
jgi:hypothetical protein